MARNLVADEIFAAMSDQLLGEQVLVLFHYDDFDRLAGNRVGNADSAHFQHAGVQRDDILDFIGIDVEAGDEDHVLLAVDNAHIAPVVDGRYIARAQKAVGSEDFGGFVRTPPIATHYLWAFDAEFSGFADRQFIAFIVADRNIGMRQRYADRAIKGLEIERVDDGGGRGFGEAIAFNQDRSRDGKPAIRHRLLHRHAAAHHDFQLGEIESAEGGVVEQRIEQGVHADQGGERMFCQRLDEAGDVAGIGDQQAARAEPEEDQATHRQGEYVVERQGDDDDLGALFDERPHPRVALLQIGDEIAMREFGAFRRAGRAAGILQQSQIVRPEIDRPQRRPPAKAQGFGKRNRVFQVEARRRALHIFDDEINKLGAGRAEQVADPHGDDMPHGRAIDDLSQCAGEILQDDNGFRLGIAQLMLEFARAIERVDIDDDIAGAERAKEGDRILQQVGRHQRHPRAARQFGDVLQIGAESLRQLAQPRKGERRAHADKGRPVGKSRRALFEKVAQRAKCADVDLRVHAFRIFRKPYPFHSALLFFLILVIAP